MTSLRPTERLKAQGGSVVRTQSAVPHSPGIRGRARVAGGTDDLRSAPKERASAFREFALLMWASDAKIEQDRLLLWSNPHIGRLDVAVNNAMRSGVATELMEDCAARAIWPTQPSATANSAVSSALLRDVPSTHSAALYRTLKASSSGVGSSMRAVPTKASRRCITPGWSMPWNAQDRSRNC